MICMAVRPADGMNSFIEREHKRRSDEAAKGI